MRTRALGALTSADVGRIARESLGLQAMAHGGSAIAGRDCKACAEMISALGLWSAAHQVEADEYRGTP